MQLNTITAKSGMNWSNFGNTANLLSSKILQAAPNKAMRKYFA